MNDEAYYRKYLNRDRVIHIADEDLKVHEKLGQLFRLEGFETIGSLSAPHFLSALERHTPDVVLLNLRLSDESGLDLMRHAKQVHRGTLVFILSNNASTEEVVEAMKLGASDVFSTPLNSERMLIAIQDSLRRDVHLGPMLNGGRAIHIRGFSTLTPRERDVLDLIVAGQSNKSSGLLLGISDRTVEVHRARVMDKLGAKNTADLMRIVLTS